MKEFSLLIIFIITTIILVLNDMGYINIKNKRIEISLNVVFVVLGIYEVFCDFKLFPLKLIDILVIAIAFIIFIDYSKEINFKIKNKIIRGIIFILAIIIFLIFIKENIITLCE